LAALAAKGYSTLTAVQTAVLDPALDGRDLRVTSQTGSGKTVAIGFALRSLVGNPSGEGGSAAPASQPPARGALARPRAIVIAPTRELARQVEEELTWLYAQAGARVACVTGGSGYGDERRALGRNPAIVVGTPGRLLEHLQRATIDATDVGAVVLDEADRLLDMGFRDDLDAIVKFAPEAHNTHLVSATFPREVRALADATQRDAVHVEGTRLGAANADIDHVVHMVDPRQRMDAIINLLLAHPDERTLVFARTRADVADITQELTACGFATASLSGEMEQAARNRAIAAFKQGDLRTLVATDVAARGIDVQDIGRVIHAEPPSDADTYTHRSGRTGRAGRKGTSCILASTSELSRTRSVLHRAGVAFRFEPLPSADSIRAAGHERAATELLAPQGDDEGIDEATWALAKRVAAEGNPTRAIARLLQKTHYTGPVEPRALRVVEAPDTRLRPRAQDARSQHARPYPQARAEGGRSPRWADAPRAPRPMDAARAPRPMDAARAPRPMDTARAPRPMDTARAPRPMDTARAPRPMHTATRGARRERDADAPAWVPFRVSWGQREGADARRLLAMACRRGQIRGADVGSIRVGPSHSVIEVASHVAEAFAVAAGHPDARDPSMTIRPEHVSRA
jgi:ATP-dependent RNA helicase DeaD